MRRLLSSRRPTSLHVSFALGLALFALQVRAAQTNSVSIADGPPFSIIRGDKVFEATKGVKLLAGDFIETQPRNFVVVELAGAAVAAIGPSTRLYFLEHSDVPTFVVTRGWLKLEAKESGEGGLHRAAGLQLGAAVREGVFVIHVADHRDELFHEAGLITLLLRDDAATRIDRESKVTQFFVREDFNPAVVAPRPAAPFIATMPVPFRDPLPFGLANESKTKITEPKLIRAVAYSDIADWLTIPRDWRTGFVHRFRGRLKDPAFFSAMDARLTQYPEWRLVLHPPPPPPPTEPTDAAPDPRNSASSKT
ncbi:MAG: FecR family protein [Steroidobacteraceae bacterium]